MSTIYDTVFPRKGGLRRTIGVYGPVDPAQEARRRRFEQVNGKQARKPHSRLKTSVRDKLRGVAKASLLIAGILMSGCDRGINPSHYPGAEWEVSPHSHCVLYEKHEYILNVSGGIIHSESCPCHKPAEALK